MLWDLQSRLKIEKLLFWIKSAQLNDKQTFYMLCASVKISFGICLCSVLISLSNVSKILQNDHFPYFSLVLVAIFVTIATVKVKLIPDYSTWAFVLINYWEETVEKQT